MADFNLEHVKHFRFAALFNELGWEKPAQQQPYTVAVGDVDFALDVVAHKRGVQVLHCRPDARGHVPDYATRQNIERKVTTEAREHLIVFSDAAQATQVWQWVSRVSGKPVQYRELHYRRGDTAELLRQKLSRLRFTLDEEALLTVLGVTRRLEDAIPRDKVTKKFYTEFKKQRDAFEQFIDGIPKLSDDLHWYAAVLIDRLMFIWFLQEKQFLDGKKRYLQERLAAHIAAVPAQSFYKAFLCPLFFRGFATERSTANSGKIEAEFGRVPYLNGGLFSQHELEQRYGDELDVADAALDKLFAFFDVWDWHLDDRPLKNDREINPDVLGYIFEKFVNQKQMGAYYTKEDITEYIGKNTIIPALLHKVRSKHAGAFDALAWQLLQAEPDRYIYPAMLKGVDQPYPADIELGRDADAPGLLARRKAWNGKSPDAWALPTEIWRETIARHERTREVRAKLAAGEVREIGDLITYNLDIRRFAQDIIERCTDAALLREFWAVLAGRVPRKAGEKFRPALSVLDPTCGSGAFLFAALNILKPLYDAALGTMAGLLLDADQAGDHKSAEKWKDIEETVERFGALSSDRARDYAVIKHIVVHNLYGVDIEEQATEIAKLRLFLKLVSFLEPGDTIEPLPDIDFNIRHGNTLVGYATADETEAAVKGATQGNLLFSDAWEDIRIRLIAVEEAYHNFQIQQVQRGGHVTAQDKQALEAQLHELEEMLNFHLCRAYGKDPTKVKQYDAWRAIHKPFHWYVDFHPLMAVGGFDAVIGNPPWIEFHKVAEPRYELRNFATQPCNNLWPFVTERSVKLCARGGALGLIVPMSLVSTERMGPVQTIVARHGGSWLSNYESDSNPGQLFDGVKQNVTVLLAGNGVGKHVHVTRLQRFFSEARDDLFQLVAYIKQPQPSIGYGFAKISSAVEARILDKLFRHVPLAVHLRNETGAAPILVHRIAHYFIKCFDFVPFFRSDRDGLKKSEDYKEYRLDRPASLYVAAVNSSLFYLYWQVFFDAFKAGKHCVESFPIGTPSAEIESSLINIGERLSADLKRNSKRLAATYKQTGQVEYDQFFPRLSKALMDEADFALAKHYGLSDEELDVVVNYDFKFRTSAQADADD